MFNHFPIENNTKGLGSAIEPEAIVDVPNIKRVFLKIGPEYARRLLDRNIINRHIAPAHVLRYLKIMQAGEWDLTHQGIAFNDRGELIDGQHRLTALTRQTQAFIFFVTEGWHSKSFRELSVDKGRKRTYADQYGHRKNTADVVTYITKFQQGQDVIEQRIQEYYLVFGEYAEALVAHCGRVVKTFASAPCRAAAILRHAEASSQEPFKQYAALVNYQYNDMWPRVQALCRRYSIQQGAFQHRDLFMRAWLAFDVTQQHSRRIVVRDTDALAREIKAHVEAIYRASMEIRP